MLGSSSPPLLFLVRVQIGFPLAAGRQAQSHGLTHARTINKIIEKKNTRLIANYNLSEIKYKKINNTCKQVNKYKYTGALT